MNKEELLNIKRKLIKKQIKRIKEELSNKPQYWNKKEKEKKLMKLYVELMATDSTIIENWFRLYF